MVLESIESFIISGRFFDVVIALFVWRLYHVAKKGPTNANISRDLAKVKADVETTYVELWDYIENTMQPIRSRLESRTRRRERAEKKDLKELEPKKKGGIMTRSQYKEYGFD